MKFGWGKRRDNASTSWPPALSEAQRHDIFYGEHHQAERQKYADTLREFGGQCMERLCVLPSRRIEPGAAWQLAHDHERGPRDYLGPAHAECNEFEAHMRGAAWAGARLLTNAEVDRIARSHDLDPPWLPFGDYEARATSMRLEHLVSDGCLYYVFTYTVTKGPQEGKTIDEWIKIGADPVDSSFNPIPFGPDVDDLARSVSTNMTEDQEALCLARLDNFGHLDPRDGAKSHIHDLEPARLLLKVAPRNDPSLFANHDVAEVVVISER